MCLLTAFFLQLLDSQKAKPLNGRTIAYKIMRIIYISNSDVCILKSVD